MLFLILANEVKVTSLRLEVTQRLCALMLLQALLPLNVYKEATLLDEPTVMAPNTQVLKFD